VGNPGHNAVTVKNGDITGFANAVEADGPLTGFALTGVTASASSNGGTALALYDTQGSVVHNDVFVGTGTTPPLGTYGVYSISDDGTSVSGVTIRSVQVGVFSARDTSESFVNNDIKAGDEGIYTQQGNDLTIRGNTLTADGTAGIGMFDSLSQNSTWSNNTANGFSYGIYAQFGSSNNWTGNVSDNDTYGADEINDSATWASDTFDNDGIGVYSFGSSGAWTNPTTNGATGDGMTMTGFTGTIAGGVADLDGGNGIDLRQPAGVTLDNNTTSGDGGAGTYIGTPETAETPETTVEDSTADNNTQYGFYAAVPTLGTNNTADSNGTANCVNVTCTS